MIFDKAKCTVMKAAYLPPALVARLDETFTLHDWDVLSPAERERLAPEVRVLAVNGESVVTDDFIAAFPNLELIADFGVGYDGIDVAAAGRRGVAVTNTPGVLTDDVADLAFGLLLATARQIVDAQRFVERGDWAKAGYMWTKKVSGGRLGIAGMGRIGQAVARRAAGFDMEIAYTDQQPVDGCPYCYLPDLASLAAASDFLIVCVNGGDKTRGMVNATVLEALGSDGVLVNIARGTVVDEAALVAAIEAGTIAGAGLDVFEHEPAVPAALQGRPNVVVTPHMASATHATRKAMGDLVFDNIAAHFAGEPLKTPVKPY
ncbi:2-hydroxyacid dehydrogenase [Azospirillum picis]|uniref:Lactate dehydrogenase-like 2-hydroxyacid dehydrogenase n=1 Tax=Azospirillum picis TaxID=488438 RepID=A0ABU0MJK7_9PROT|nr:2-hydroxyacid dehydrogenase [Azospirillum picis]MBP2299854.1 lactate dehydrogenase-like 2-hydroxyacid dehydrogenase [Azospirillum picis]MDQ0533650.1 lactate dehydrogenase-like 2-hydroxyacid dehydrogenase [Azospirillum picis]